ncbi:hypothetical protein [Aequorivita antarctica]|uniref:Uncharacterized protein n=1 Tax=Aequorivita antarctica TaxID=153266 RepID=A0A5C6YYM3_9FLAO|nr:hypothetical protein [Aequorivita antarctica]TXD72361.1 hypothetical protein ESU54_13145 [Aequorivita antarctica]SRX74504.1 hypothetical protein AEQU3_01483 [Aequorivita antarctica]
MFYFGGMKPKLKAKLFRFSFLLNAFIFLLGGLSLLEEGKYALAILQFVTALFNLFMLLKRISPKRRITLNYIILILNILVAASVALDYYFMGKEKIKYLWFFAAFMYTVALIVKVRKQRSRQQL